MVTSAILIALGVSAIAVVIFLSVFLRRRWLIRRPSGFVGAARVTSGELPGFGKKWRRGLGWADDGLHWVKLPFLFRKEVVAISGVSTGRPSDAAGVKRLGDNPVAFEFQIDGATLELAAKAEDRELVRHTINVP